MEIAMSAHPTQSAPTSQTQSGMGLAIAGYVFALLIPIIGLIIGIVVTKRHSGVGVNHGVWIILVAVLSAVASVAMLSAAGSYA
jgi:hypothetical protein